MEAVPYMRALTGNGCRLGGRCVGVLHVRSPWSVERRGERAREGSVLAPWTREAEGVFEVCVPHLESNSGVWLTVEEG